MAKEIKIIDFSGKRKMFFVLSIILVVVALASSLIGVELAIEFKGGTIISYSYTGTIDTATAKSDVESIVNTQVNIQHGDSMDGSSKTLTISFSSNEGLTAEKQGELTTKLEEIYKDNAIELLDSNDVSPSSGKQFFLKCLVAVAFASLLLVLYISWRFKKISGWSAGMFAIVALVHDVIIAYGAFVICRFEINANFMAVILTILGTSINNTIVVYDRIRENQKLMARAPISELVNVSVTQSITRSVRTSTTTVCSMVIVCIVSVVFKSDAILTFAVPMMVGMIVGTYSSLCLAPTLWLAWQERKKKAPKKA